MVASLARATLVVVGLATAHTWTKVVEPEVSHKEAGGNGTWGVTVGTRAICYTGQPYSDCVNAYVDQYNSACVGRELVGNSQLTCDRAYDTIQSMKTSDCTQCGPTPHRAGPYEGVTPCLPADSSHGVCSQISE